MAETKTTFSLRKLVGKADAIIIKTLNHVGVAVNKAIQDNINDGIDLDGSAFESLSPSTQRQRTTKTGYYKKAGGGGILNWQGSVGSRKALRETRLVKAKKGKLNYTITMFNKHGAYHNEGGGKLPKRKWFGIPKSAQGNVDVAMETLQLEIVKAWRKK